MRQDFSADGSSTEIVVQAGNHALEAQGTWGGGTVIVESNRGLGWNPLPGVSLNADGQLLFECDNCRLRLTLSGATAPDLAVVLH